MKKVIIIAICIFVTFSGCAFKKEILIPRAKIQEAISKKFPYQKDALIARLTMQTPEVYFKGKNIGLRVFYYGNFLAQEIKGFVDVYGNITYEPETGTLYLHDFTIADITANENNLLEKINLQKIIDKVATDYLDGLPVYRLDPHDYKENLARLLVKDIFVRNDDLVIVLGN